MEQPLILDRYRPLAELGSGGHASVTLAYDTKMGRRVAIKRLPLPPDSTRRVGLAEARTAAMLAHPSIVTVFEWDTDPDEAFLIMEFVEGVSLAELLDRLGRLDLDETAAVLEPIAEALSFAHDNGVLHLDVKPENVLVTRDGRAKMADFGVASLTGLGGAALGSEGTLGFMPPEQLRAEPVDARADEWALASLTYEALTGANPFATGTREAALARAEELDVPGPSELLREVPAAVDDVLFAALAPEPAERYPGIAAFAATLLPHLGDAAAGRASLAAVVEELTADEVAEEEAELGRLGLWDRLAPWSGIALRSGGALVCAWLAFAGFLPWRFGLLATAGACVLVAAAALGAPALGLALGLGAFALGGFHVSPAAGVATLVFGLALWLLLGRRGRGDSLLAASAPALAVPRVAPLVPLVLGFTYEPLAAAAAAGFASLAVMAASAASGSGPPLLAVDPAVLLDPFAALRVTGRFAAFATPGPYIAVVGWATAAAVVSVACARGTRLAAGAGVAGGTLVLGAAYFLWAPLAPGTLVWPSAVVLQQLAGSLILMVVVIALGPPVRGEGDDEAIAEEAG